MNDQCCKECGQPLPVDDFAGRLKKARIESGMSQGDLAEKLGVNQSILSRYENGRMSPKINALPSIATALSVTTDYLILGD